MPTLKQLQNFIVLARELHFAKAAQLLGISQSALSNEIKKLETSVGCQLLDRSDRWMIKLTEAGSIYLRQIKELPELMAEAGQMARKAARGDIGTLSIGVAGLIYDFVDIGRLCKDMLQKYPDVKLRIYDTLVSPAAASLVRSGKCDISFFAASNISNNMENLLYKKTVDIPLAFAIPANNPLAHKENLTIQDLKYSHFIFPPPGRSSTSAQSL
jgi:DNA-binding transcriptional LysR family regulator